MNVSIIFNLKKSISSHENRLNKSRNRNLPSWIPQMNPMDYRIGITIKSFPPSVAVEQAEIKNSIIQPLKFLVVFWKLYDALCIFWILPQPCSKQTLLLIALEWIEKKSFVVFKWYEGWYCLSQHIEDRSLLDVVRQ